MWFAVGCRLCLTASFSVSSCRWKYHSHIYTYFSERRINLKFTNEIGIRCCFLLWETKGRQSVSEGFQSFTTFEHERKSKWWTRRISSLLITLHHVERFSSFFWASTWLHRQNQRRCVFDFIHIFWRCCCCQHVYILRASHGVFDISRIDFQTFVESQSWRLVRAQRQFVWKSFERILFYELYYARESWRKSHEKKWLWATKSERFSISIDFTFHIFLHAETFSFSQLQALVKIDFLFHSTSEHLENETRWMLTSEVLKAEQIFDNTQKIQKLLLTFSQSFARAHTATEKCPLKKQKEKQEFPISSLNFIYYPFFGKKALNWFYDYCHCKLFKAPQRSH